MSEQQDQQNLTIETPVVVVEKASDEPKEKVWLEGNEVDGKISDFGAYALDISQSGDVVAHVEADYKKDVLSWLGVTVSGKVSVKADLVTVILGYAQKSNKTIIKTLAAKLAAKFGK